MQVENGSRLRGMYVEGRKEGNVGGFAWRGEGLEEVDHYAGSM